MIFVVAVTIVVIGFILIARILFGQPGNTVRDGDGGFYPIADQGSGDGSSSDGWGDGGGADGGGDGGGGDGGGD